MKFWCSLIIIFQTVVLFSQENKILNLNYEICDNYETSLCGNYFEQNIMRFPVLIKVNKDCFIKSYDTIYVMDKPVLDVLNNRIEIDKKGIDTITINYSKKYFNKVKRYLNKHNYKSKPNNRFKYLDLNMIFYYKYEKIDTIYIPNPQFNKRNDFLIPIKTVKMRITKIGEKTKL